MKIKYKNIIIIKLLSYIYKKINIFQIMIVEIQKKKL